jgi:hypothetical protein
VQAEEASFPGALIEEVRAQAAPLEVMGSESKSG